MLRIKINATYRFDGNRIILIGSNIIAHDLKKRLFSNLTVPCEFTFESINSRGLPILNVVYADFESKEDLQYYFMLNSELYKELTNVR